MSLEIGDAYRIRKSNIICIAISETTLVAKLANDPELFYIQETRFPLVHLPDYPLSNLLKNWNVTSEEYSLLVGATLREILKATTQASLPALTQDIEKLTKAVRPKKKVPKKLPKPLPIEPIDEDRLLAYYQPRMIEEVIRRFNGIPTRDTPMPKRLAFIKAMVDTGIDYDHVAKIMGVQKQYIYRILREAGWDAFPDLTKKGIASREQTIADNLYRIQSGEISIVKLARELRTSHEKVREVMRARGIQPPAHRTYPNRKPRKAVIKRLEGILRKMRDGVTLWKACDENSTNYRTIQGVLDRLEKQGYTMEYLLANGLPY